MNTQEQGLKGSIKASKVDISIARDINILNIEGYEKKDLVAIPIEYLDILYSSLNELDLNQYKEFLIDKIKKNQSIESIDEMLQSHITNNKMIRVTKEFLDSTIS